ncbi:MAG: hypothetical protein EON86_07975, partial [Brevundimonas sp.]
MISNSLRSVLSVAGLVVLILGSIGGVLYPALLLFIDQMTVGEAIGVALRLVLASAFFGGVLRLLVSID